jgi:hypothetical protein
MPKEARVLISLLGVATALLVVGIVSGTFLRHVVQILPIIAAAGVLARRPDWGAYAAVPIFIFWILIVALIWLFLLGLSRIANGHYTPIEILLTLIMAGFSIAGLVTSLRLGTSQRLVIRMLAFTLFGVLQIVAMRVSLLEPIATR